MSATDSGVIIQRLLILSPADCFFRTEERKTMDGHGCSIVRQAIEQATQSMVGTRLEASVVVSNADRCRHVGAHTKLIIKNRFYATRASGSNASESRSLGNVADARRLFCSKSKEVNLLIFVMSHDMLEDFIMHLYEKQFRRTLRTPDGFSFSKVFGVSIEFNGDTKKRIIKSWGAEAPTRYLTAAELDGIGDFDRVDVYQNGDTYGDGSDHDDDNEDKF